MNKMRKAAVLACACTLTLAMSTTVFAAESPKGVTLSFEGTSNISQEEASEYEAILDSMGVESGEYTCVYIGDATTSNGEATFASYSGLVDGLTVEGDEVEVIHFYNDEWRFESAKVNDDGQVLVTLTDGCSPVVIFVKNTAEVVEPVAQSSAPVQPAAEDEKTEEEAEVEEKTEEEAEVEEKTEEEADAEEKTEEEVTDDESTTDDTAVATSGAASESTGKTTTSSTSSAAVKSSGTTSPKTGEACAAMALAAVMAVGAAGMVVSKRRHTA